MKFPCDSVPFFATWSHTLREKLNDKEASKIEELYFNWAFCGEEPDFESMKPKEYFAFRYLQSELEAL